MRIVNAQLRYYMHVNPDELSDPEWANMYKELEYIRLKENEK